MVSGTTGNVVEGNYIGTDVSGTTALTALGDANGVEIDSGASGNTIGGTVAGAGNLISGNGWDGVVLLDSGTTSNAVEGNFIGTDVTGGTAVGNQGNGVEIYSGASGNTIGGTTAGARNIISGNIGQGVAVWDTGTTGNMVEGNYIGTDVSGAKPWATGATRGSKFFPGPPAIQSAVQWPARGTSSLATGGTASRSRFPGPRQHGRRELHRHRRFGRHRSGQRGRRGHDRFRGLRQHDWRYRGPARNIISGNAEYYGVELWATGTTDNVVEGNYIGTDASGSTALGNRWGVEIDNGASGNTIGGTVAGAGNIISGNAAYGVVVWSSRNHGQHGRRELHRHGRVGEQGPGQ